MAKNKNKNKNHDRDLLLVAGFDDVPSALAALDSQSLELRSIEKDYDALLTKTLELENRLEEAHRVIVSQAIQIHTLTEDRNAEESH